MKKLILHFEEKNGKRYKIQILDAKAGLKGDDVRAVMQEIVTNAIFDRPISEPIESYYITTSREELD